MKQIVATGLPTGRSETRLDKRIEQARLKTRLYY
jgi:hypothetical protein